VVDDVIDSGWTVTVLAALLRRAGSGPVFPVALASTTSCDRMTVSETTQAVLLLTA
jgi:ATP-dependent DNA helicase RecQ